MSDPAASCGGGDSGAHKGAIRSLQALTCKDAHMFYWEETATAVARDPYHLGRSEVHSVCVGAKEITAYRLLPAGDAYFRRSDPLILLDEVTLGMVAKDPLFAAASINETTVDGRRRFELIKDVPAHTEYLREEDTPPCDGEGWYCPSTMKPPGEWKDGDYAHGPRRPRKPVTWDNLHDLPQVIVVGKRDMVPKAYRIVNLSSSSRSEYRALSPFVLSPAGVIVGDYKTVVFGCLENVWQTMKWFPRVSDEEFKATVRREAQSERVNKNPYRAKRGERFAGIVHKGRLLPYIEARFKVYLANYLSALERSPRARRAIKQLKGAVTRGEKLALWDPDGYVGLASGITIREMIYNAERPFPHSAIVAMLITGQCISPDDYNHLRPYKREVRAFGPHLRGEG